MGQIAGVVRVWGATATEVLSACVSQARWVSIDHHLVLGPMTHEGITVHYLQTRTDGVVVMGCDGGTPSFSAPASWVIFQSTSCSKGIDYESLVVRRGDEVLASLTEGPDGDLEVKHAGAIVESIEQRWTEGGEPIPREKATTFAQLVEKWLPVIAADLGEARVVLTSEGDLASPPAAPTPEAEGIEYGDDIPF